MKKTVLTTVLLVLILSFPLASSPVMAAGSLTVTPSPVSRTVSDDTLAGDSISVTIRNNGDSTVSNIRASKSGQIASWITFSSSTWYQINPGGAVTLVVNVKPPYGQAPGTYTGTATFSGTDVRTGKEVSTSVYFTITVPRRPAWIVRPLYINGEAGSIVYVGKQFYLSVEVCNSGNVPLTNICASLTLPSTYFKMVSPNTVSVGNLNNCGEKVTIRWYALATRPTGTYIQVTATVSSNMGTRILTKSIRAI